jgi:hypothetical protein
LWIVVAEEQWNETEHELGRHMAINVEWAQLTGRQAQALRLPSTC